jgi:hypothetical protein
LLSANANPKSPLPMRSALLGSDLYLCPRSPAASIDSNAFDDSLHLLPIEINEPHSLPHGPGRHQNGRRHATEKSDRPVPTEYDHKSPRKIHVMPRLNLNRAHDAAASAKSGSMESAARDEDAAHHDQDTVMRGCRTRCPDWPRQVYAVDTPRSAVGSPRGTASPRGKLWNAVRARKFISAARACARHSAPIPSGEGPGPENRGGNLGRRRRGEGANTNASGEPPLTAYAPRRAARRRPAATARRRGPTRAERPRRPRWRRSARGSTPRSPRSPPTGARRPPRAPPGRMRRRSARTRCCAASAAWRTASPP